MSFQPVPPDLANLPPNFKGPGAMIISVNPDSPAQKAGLKPLDIVTAYNQHEVTSPDQLVKMVYDDKPGNQVAIDVFRNGKKESVKVALGERPATPPAGFPGNPPSGPFPGPNPPLTGARPGVNWDNFDSLTLTRVDEQRFKAEIAYKNDKGKVERKSFEGTRDEIRQKIETARDLPAPERNHLMRSLGIMPGR